MRGICFAAAAVLGGLAELPAAEPRAQLLTVAQRDRLRSPSSPASVSIGADGRYIAFSSYERLTPDDDDRLSDIYMLDSITGVVTLESIAIDRTHVIADCFFPRISGNGRYLVFESASIAADAADPFVEIVLRDRLSNITRRISRNEAGQPADGWSGNAAVSDDGRTVVFESSATNLVPGIDANGERPDIYMIDTATGRVSRISLDANGVQPKEGLSVGATISADGRYVAFTSSAPLMDDASKSAAVAGTARLSHVYVRDTQLNVLKRINATSAGAVPNDSSYRPIVSRDGAFIAFVSTATNLVSGDQNRSSDVFLYDTRTAVTTLISRNRNGKSANGTSGNPSISADGRLVAFQSDASDLVCSRRCPPSAEDINLLPDVFLFDRSTKLITWVSTGGSGGWMEESTAPALDGTGRVVAFSSRHPTDQGDTGHDFDLFVRMPVDSR